jgi:hypothetical protein
MEPAKLNFRIYQGSTFLQQLRWESETKTYIPITNITKSAPVEITVGDSTLLPPVGWRVRVTNVLGMKEINMPEETYYILTEKLNSVIKINTINSIGYSTYTSGGILEFNTPVSLENYTARMQIRKKLNDPEVVLSLTTENGGIVLDNTAKTITINITAQQTSSLTFSSMVYDLELISGSVVTRFAQGNLILNKEVTRDG